MKIAIFGCSWSYGVPRSWHQKITTTEKRPSIPKEDFVCWPRELGKLNPDWQIVSYAIPGSNMLFSCSALDYALENEEYDLHIFQATTPYRFTYWKDDTFTNAKFKAFEPNVMAGSKENLENITIVNIHNGRNNVDQSNLTWRENGIETAFVKNYYRRVSNSMFESEYRILCNWAKSKSDIFFSHLDYDFLNCDSIEGTLGKNKFNEYTVDNGSHFGIAGARWQAKWMQDKINTL